MIQKISADGFKWCEKPDRFTADKINKLPDLYVDKGYILEVNVSYPKELHDEHNNLPFLPERKTVNKVEKLVPCLSDKNNYVVHIRTLNQALEHGLILEKVHRAVEFNKSAWLKPYIDFNT